MTKLLSAASAAALLTIVGMTPSLAQSTATTAASSGSMPSITCRDIASLDQESAKGVFYYLAGLHKGMSGSMNQAATGSGTTGTTTSGSTASNSGSAASGSDTSDTTASTTVPDSTSGTSGTSGTTGTSDSSGSSNTTASNTGSSGATSTTGTATTGSGTASMNVAGIPELSMINVSQLMSACQQSPDMQVSQVISQQMGMSGTSAQ